MKRLRNIHIKSLVLSIAFLLVIYMPFFDHVLHLSTPNLPSENRRLTEKPKVDITSLDYFPKEYDAYFNDHFNYRNDLILLNTSYKFNMLGISPFEKVAEGKDGWLFHYEYLEDYRGKNLFSKEDLKKIAKALEYRQKWLNDRGIKFYMAVAPNKASIYEEYVPDYVFRIHGTSKYDQIMDYLEENSTFNLIDLKDVILENKKDQLLYFKTDPHWNILGAFNAYEEIMKAIKRDFPDIDPLTLNDFSLEYDTTEGKGLARMLNMVSEYSDIDIKFEPKFKRKATVGKKKDYPIPEEFYYKSEYELVWHVPDSRQPKAMIIRDSFTNALILRFAETFGHTLYLWDVWKYQLNKEIVENEKPDILLILIIEKNLPMFFENIEDFELESSQLQTRHYSSDD
ncbi:MAG: hypothetical protein K8R86_03810 [Bacteroidales bacterium]|nr:hypothetical protein [Bacteroidales bacterium]